MRYLLLVLFLVNTICSFAQSAVELNEQSKAMLAKKDYKNAVPLVRKAADMGNAEAQYNLGYCYQEGIEVTKSDMLAQGLYLKSAKQGWKDAQYKLAINYATGRGVEKNDKESFYWAMKCAKQNDPKCIWNVIGCYKEGRGVEKNTDSMLYWAIYLGSLKNTEDLKMSAQITNARLNLAKMYQTGNDVEKSYLKSYTWYLMYNESKRDHSIIMQQVQINNIKELEKQLSAEQKEAAKKQAEAYLKMPLQNIANLYKEDK